MCSNHHDICVKQLRLKMVQKVEGDWNAVELADDMMAAPGQKICFSANSMLSGSETYTGARDENQALML
jgi:hypothetical protein